MNAKSKVFVYLLMVLMLALQAMPASAQSGMPPLVETTISDEPSHEDKNWPIIKSETHKRKDPSTGMDIVETTVVRRMPPTKENMECENKSTSGRGKFDSAATLVSTCMLYRTSITTSATSSVAGGYVTAYAINYADQYCNSAGECGFVKMKRLEIYWTRTDPILAW
jgi:hypothetical protein